MDVTFAEQRERQEATPDMASLRDTDAIIIGETHNIRAHQIDQARLITILQPEYVLHEGWDEATPEDTNKIIRCYALATLQDVVGKSYSPEQLGITKDVFLRIEQKKSERYEQYRELYQKKGLTPAGASQEAKNLVEKDGVYPRSFTELLETPFYEWGMPVCEAVQELLLEETNGSSDLRDVRKRGAKRIREQKLHHERAQGLDYLYRAIAKAEGKLAGCDINKSLPRLEDVIEEDRRGGSVESPDAITGKETVSGYTDSYDRYKERLVAYIQNMNAMRERTMGVRIVDYARKKTAKKPLFAIVGSHHARPDSGIYPVLEVAGVRWKTIIQEEPENLLVNDVEYVLQLGAQ
ncbi:MAG: hypothetical protein Q8R53_04390 [Nanoarchaeota archaeon]|nr:hypothetical protein [Nanoarchaeota archaeon]